MGIRESATRYLLNGIGFRQGIPYCRYAGGLAPFRSSRRRQTAEARPETPPPHATLWRTKLRLGYVLSGTANQTRIARTMKSNGTNVAMFLINYHILK